MQKLNPWFEYDRVAPPYDFRRPPNNGQLSRNYERAGVTLSRWDA
jgi:hypothetical protein